MRARARIRRAAVGVFQDRRDLRDIGDVRRAVTRIERRGEVAEQVANHFAYDALSSSAL